MAEEERLELPYFYGAEAERFAFYRIPKVFFTEPCFGSLSLHAKLLYGLMLDRMQLSLKNSWVDGQGRVYIYYKLENVLCDMNCANQKAAKLLKELEVYGLIERKRQGLNMPARIYVKDFSALLQKSQVRSCENHDSGVVKITSPDLRKSLPNNTEYINKTEGNDTEAIYRSEDDGGPMDGYGTYREYVMERISFDALVNDYPCDREALEEILDLITETLATERTTIRVCGEDKPAQVVKSRFMKLNSEHIRYVMGCLKQNTTKVRNIRQYLMAALYNASMTMSNYYNALVAHDMYGDGDG